MVGWFKVVSVYLLCILCARPLLAITLKDDSGMEMVLSGYSEGQISKYDDQNKSDFDHRSIAAVKSNTVINSSLTQVVDDDSTAGATLNLAFGSASYESRGSAAALNDAFISYHSASLGAVEIGVTHPVTEKFRRDSSTFARGSGGINGDYFRFVRYHLDSTNMILSPQMPTAGGFATSNYIGVQNNVGVLQNYFNGARAAKLSIISKKHNGFTFGASLTPSLYDKYTALGSSQNDMSNITDPNNNFDVVQSVSIVANYDKQITQDVAISASSSYEGGEAQKLRRGYAWKERDHLSSASFGFNANYKKWFTGGSYVYYGRSLFYKPDGTAATMRINSDGSLSKFRDSYLYNLGIGYISDEWGISSSYLAGDYMDNKSQIFNVSLDCNVKLGKLTLKEYIEAAYVMVSYPRYFDKQNVLQTNNTTESFVLFLGFRVMI